MQQNSHSHNLQVLLSGSGLGKIFGSSQNYANHHHSLRLTAGKQFNKYSSIPNFANPINLGSPPSDKEKRKLMILHEQGHIPDSFDWRQKSKKLNIKMEDVKNQQHCGCCWAMASASTLSDRFNISNKKGDITPDLSPLELAKCIPLSEGQGCGGGSLNYSTDYMKKYGLISNKIANFENACSDPNCNSLPGCKQSWNNEQRYKITEARTILGDENSNPINTRVGAQAYNNHFGDIEVTFDRDPISIQNQMKAQIFSHGPLIASFNVYSDFQDTTQWSATNKIYIHEAYGSTTWAGGHAIEIVGWGIDRNVPNYGKIEYWIVKNSWGPTWNNDGYCKFAMTKYISQKGQNILSTTINGFTGIDVPFLLAGQQRLGGGNGGGGNGGGGNGGGGNGGGTSHNKKWLQKYWWIILIAILIIGILVIFLAARA
jgi:hypothetical protein